LVTPGRWELGGTGKLLIDDTGRSKVCGDCCTERYYQLYTCYDCVATGIWLHLSGAGIAPDEYVSVNGVCYHRGGEQTLADVPGGDTILESGDWTDVPDPGVGCCDWVNLVSCGCADLGWVRGDNYSDEEKLIYNGNCAKTESTHAWFQSVSSWGSPDFCNYESGHGSVDHNLIGIADSRCFPSRIDFTISGLALFSTCCNVNGGTIWTQWESFSYPASHFVTFNSCGQQTGSSGLGLRGTVSERVWGLGHPTPCGAGSASPIPNTLEFSWDYDCATHKLTRVELKNGSAGVKAFEWNGSVDLPATVPNQTVINCNDHETYCADGGSVTVAVTY